MRQGPAQALIAGAAILLAATLAAAVLQKRQKQRSPQRMFDYSDRSGFPRPPAEMRGKGRAKKERASGPPSLESAVRV